MAENGARSTSDLRDAEQAAGARRRGSMADLSQGRFTPSGTRRVEDSALGRAGLHVLRLGTKAARKARKSGTRCIRPGIGLRLRDRRRSRGC